MVAKGINARHLVVDWERTVLSMVGTTLAGYEEEVSVATTSYGNLRSGHPTTLQEILIGDGKEADDLVDACRAAIREGAQWATQGMPSSGKAR